MALNLYQILLKRRNVSVVQTLYQLVNRFVTRHLLVDMLVRLNVMWVNALLVKYLYKFLADVNLPSLKRSVLRFVKPLAASHLYVIGYVKQVETAVVTSAVLSVVLQLKSAERVEREQSSCTIALIAVTRHYHVASINVKANVIKENVRHV